MFINGDRTQPICLWSTGKCNTKYSTVSIRSNRTLSQHSTLCIHLRVSLRGPMLANVSMADPGTWNIAPLSSLSTVTKVRSLVREADIDARR